MTRIWLHWIWLVLCASLLLGDPIVYVDPDAPSCDGLSPCVATPDAAVALVDAGGEIVLRESLVGNLTGTGGKSGVTVRSAGAGVVLTGRVRIFGATDFVDGWVFQGFETTEAFHLRNLVNSVTIEDITAPELRLGRFTQDTTAQIVVRGVSVPTTNGELNVLGDPGFDLGGSILIEDSSMWACNIQAQVAPGPSTALSADITFQDNFVDRAVNVQLIDAGSAGNGQISGEIQFLDNDGTADDALLAVSVAGDAAGPILSEVLFSNNDVASLAVQTRESSVGGDVHQVTATGNLIQAMEIQAVGGELIGPVVLTGNTVVDRGAPLPISGPYLQINGDPLPGPVTVSGTLGGQALISIRSPASGELSGAVSLHDNAVNRIILESREGDLSSDLSILRNTLPPAQEAGDSSLTIQTDAAWNLQGGLLEGNELDVLQFDVGGSLVGTMTARGNVIRDVASYIFASGASTGVSEVHNNDFQELLYIDGVITNAATNRIGTRLTAVTPTIVTAENNWWRCSTGPGQTCSTRTAGVDTDPWLTLRSSAECLTATSARAQFDLLENSDGQMPAGNAVPGVAVITSVDATVLDTPVLLVDGMGTSDVTHGLGIVPTIDVSIDLAGSSSQPGVCGLPFFDDGFESGNTNSWSSTG